MSPLEQAERDYWERQDGPQETGRSWMVEALADRMAPRRRHTDPEVQR